VSAVSQGDRLERERAGLEEEEELEAEEMLKRTLKRMGIEVVEEDEELEGEVDRRVVPQVVVEARELAERYGKCRAAYLLKVNWGLKPIVIARLLGANPSTVRSCINYHGKRDRHAELQLGPPVLAFKQYGELCRDVYSLECQLLEAEMFMYNVARWATPEFPTWLSMYLSAASIHRLAFPEVYTLLKHYAETVKVDFRSLLRAYKPRGSTFWAVGDGMLAYAYAVIELAYRMRGYSIYDYMGRVRDAVYQLTGLKRNPAEPRLAPLIAMITFKLAQLYHERFEEIYSMRKKLEGELLAALRKAKG
jgi:hypothetical protein